MGKIGRNQPCPCASGKKFKHCHGTNNYNSNAPIVPLPAFAGLEWKLTAMESLRVQREKQQGLGRPIISQMINDDRFVAVGADLLHSKQWKTFHDFLRDFLIEKLDKNWFQFELTKKGVDQHQIVKWYVQANGDALQHGIKVDDVYIAPMTGAQRAFQNLAYNIYLIAHHSEPKKVNALLKTFLVRLKSERTDDFIGKLFETYAAAAFLKAGFEVEYEDETSGCDSKVEFVATYPATGKKFSVEVKSRNRSQSEEGSIDDHKRLRIANKLNKALMKKASHTRVILIEVNVPDAFEGTEFAGWPKSALEQVREVEQKNAPDGSKKPQAYVIVTNHAFHNNLEIPDIGLQLVAVGCCIPDFGPDISFSRLKDILESEMRHKEIFALLDSVRAHYEIPSTFDGKNPELAFRATGDMQPLRIGQVYSVANGQKGEVDARLVNVIVDEKQKVSRGIYSAVEGGRTIILESSFSDLELAAWKRHPETYFGHVTKPTHKSESWLDLAKFMYDSYKKTERMKLLEWMKDAIDFDALSELPQNELAIIYCERCAWGLHEQAHKKS